MDISRFNSPEANSRGTGVPVGESDPEVQEQIRADEEAAAAAAAETVVEPAVETPPVVPVAETPVVVAPAVPAEEEDDLFRKVDGGWEVRVKSLIPGGQDQVYRGKTQKEVARKMAEGQAHAQQRIHELDRAKRLKNILLEPEVLAPAPTFERRQLSADETYKLTNQLSDPAKAPAALRTLMEAELGAPLETVRGALSRTSLEAEENRSRVIAREWVTNNPSFYASPDNIQAMGNFFKERSWSVTTKNMDIAYSFLDASGALSDAPIEEEVRETVPAASAAVPAATPAAAPAAAVPATPPAPASALPARPPVYRPAGPSSTGVTRDSATVRPASQPAVPATPKVVLSVEEYRKTPMAEVRRRYRQEPGYKAAVDALIASNQI